MKKKFVSFEEARKVVRNLRLKSQTDWLEWCKSGKKPDIPANPNTMYKDKGWVS